MHLKEISLDVILEQLKYLLCLVWTKLFFTYHNVSNEY